VFSFSFTMAQSPNDPLADQVLHIQLLQEKNRLMKRMKKTDDTKLEREQGFNTYFSGANTILADRLKQKNFLRQNANNTGAYPKFLCYPLVFFISNEFP
jgi:hypothetical protein